MRFRDTRPERKEKPTKPLVGSPEALGRLLSLLPKGLPHGVSWAMPREQRREARLARLRRWSWHFRVKARERALERHGLDVTGPDAEVADARRVLRNARKRERRAS